MSKRTDRKIEGPFVPIQLDLLMSDAWRGLSINSYKLLSFLMAELLRHNRLENGKLKATYKQLKDYGLSYNLISKAIAECEERGLITVEHQPREFFNESYPNLFGLTFMWTHARKEGGDRYSEFPTDEWKRWKGPKQKPSKTKSDAQNRYCASTRSGTLG